MFFIAQFNDALGNLFEFIVVEEDIEFWSTADADPTKIKVVKSNTNQKFFDFIRFINDRLKSRQPLDACLADSTKKEEEKKEEAAPATPAGPSQEELLTQIRDLLKK